ncbi:hypothetical protein TWF281_007722 [Arthrobotrys megalospora]
MPFVSQIKLQNGASGQEHSGISSVVYEGELFVFYHGAGNDGIYLTRTTNGKDWTVTQNLVNSIDHMGVEKETSPSAVVFNNKIYLFYTGAGGDGAYYSTYNGSSWSSLTSVRAKIPNGMGMAYGSSVYPTVIKGKLYIYWSGSGNDGIFYSSTDGGDWAGAKAMNDNVHRGGIGLYKGSSPTATSYDIPTADVSGELIYYNGAGGNGIYQVRNADDEWTVRNLANDIKGIHWRSSVDYTANPIAILSADKSKKQLFWSGADQGIWYSDSKVLKNEWKDATPLRNDVGTMGVRSGCGPSVVIFKDATYIFWVGAGDYHIYYTHN